MNPRNITKGHILKAVEEVKRKGISAKHGAKDWPISLDRSAVFLSRSLLIASPLPGTMNVTLLSACVWPDPVGAF